VAPARWIAPTAGVRAYPHAEGEVMDTAQTLLAECERLTHELAESRERAYDLAVTLEAHTKATEGPEAIAKEAARLHGTIRTLEAVCDSYRTKCDVLTEMKAARERQLARRERAQ
jgi:hypothetical protein